MPARTTPLLDNFTRANENPLATSTSGYSWQSFTGAGGVGLSALRVVSNLCTPVGAANNMFLNVVDAPHCEVWGTLGAAGSNNDYFDVALRLVDTAAITSIDGYSLRYTQLAGTDTLGIYRIDNLTATLISSTFNQDMAVGETALLRAVGSTLEAWHLSTAGVWTRVGTTTDATYSNGGVKCITISSTTMSLSAFGGGTYNPSRLATLGVG